MFLVRSVFWLALAFMVIKPGVDLTTATDLSNQAVAAGQQMVAGQIANIECDSFQCVGGKAMLAAALTTLPPSPPAVGAPMHDSPADPVPYPRPRLDRAG